MRIKTVTTLLLTGLTVSGCTQIDRSKTVFFLDGASHVGAGGSVKRGLRAAGFDGDFKGFVWTSGMLWAVDHLMAANSEHNASRLATQIVERRQSNPEGYVALMGLSAGTTIILNALERLPEDIDVDYVVLFQPSVSSTRNLAPALRHVRNRLYATSSRSDGILASMAITADGETGPPAGRSGFRVPYGLSRADREQYTKIVNLPWRTRYNKHGWNGGHVASTRSSFVKAIIAPRVLPDESAPTSSAHLADAPRPNRSGNAAKPVSARAISMSEAK